MILESRSFIGDTFTRPTPEVFVDEVTGFCLVVTPWGMRSVIKQFQQTITDYYLSASKDVEITSPYPLLPHLSKPANDLRTAVMLAVQWLYTECNKNEYQCGVELFTVAQIDEQLLWIKCGNPHFIFCKKDYGMIPIAWDMSMPLQMSKPEAPPLPTHLLGFYNNVDISVQEMKVQAKDKLILISRQSFDPSILKLTQEQWTLDDISRVLSQDSKEPFWAGLVVI